MFYLEINSLDIGGPERRKIDNTGEDLPQVGSKVLLINTFSNWMMEWNKVRNWNNKKVLLNLVLILLPRFLTRNKFEKIH